MKKLIFCLIVVLGVDAYAQNFEGTIQWKMDMTITDPALKAKMEEGQRKMNDPATKAKMKEMQDKMKDPQFKAMMESNPQMKAQMEAMTKMMAGGDFNAMMPKGMTLKIKGPNTLTVMDGGMMDKMEVLHQGTNGKTVRIDRASKTYTVMNTRGDQRPHSEAKVSKTNETQKILNYTCTKYIVESTTPEGKKLEQTFWTTKEIDVDMKALSQQQSAKGTPMFYENIEGTPLKIEVKMPDGNMTMEATSVKKEALNQKDFEIPATFTETKF